MHEIFESAGLDVRILYCFGFALLGTVLLVLPRQASRSRFIVLLPLLATFGLVHAAVEFAGLLRIEHHIHEESVEWCIAALLFISFIPLLEFGRRLNWASSSLKSTVWLYTGLVLSAFAFAMLTQQPRLGFIIATRFILGLSATLICSYAFWKEYRLMRRQDTPLALPYMTVAGAFLIYGLATTVMPGEDPGFPALFMTEAQFLNHFGFPVFVVRAACAVVIALATVVIVRRINFENTQREMAYLRKIGRMDEVQRLNEEMAAEIEHRREIELQLRILSMAFETEEAIMITDADRIILKVNHAFSRMTGYEIDEILGKTPSVLQSGIHDANFYRSMWKSIDETGTWQGEMWDRRKNGETFPMWVTISSINDEQGHLSNYVWSSIDISDRKRAEEKINYMAYHDQLTALPNRELFYDRLSHAMSQARRHHERMALLYLDLNGFKDINDRYGHHAGDAVLKEAAERLNHCVRDADTVARLGGDEFAIVLGEIKKNEDAILVTEKVLSKLTQPMILHETLTCTVGASVGIALFPDDGEEIDRLVNAADRAMYESKHAGGNVYALAKNHQASEDAKQPWIMLGEHDLLGIESMDHQHQELVKSLNRLNASINANAPVEHAKALFDAFVEKAGSHFEAEERLMAQYGFHQPEHQQEHLHLLRQVRDLRESFAQSGKPLVLKSLKDWLLEHVKRSDKDFADFLLKHRANKRSPSP